MQEIMKLTKYILKYLLIAIRMWKDKLEIQCKIYCHQDLGSQCIIHLKYYNFETCKNAKARNIPAWQDA